MENCAIQVVRNSDHCFLLNDEELEKILLDEDIKEYNAVVVSVTGVFRKGKSFLLDFFIRYLKSKYVKKEKDWIGEEDEPLDGFRWRGGAERETTGIQMWSEIYKTEIEGEKIAVILLDTQGTFDSQSTVKDCATVFALSTMLSSIQIYNLSQNIQEDDLQHLQLFTEYGKLALSQSCATPFQKLEFLIRDWSFPYETPYGETGGKMLLNKRLEINETQHPELQSLRKHIKSCFSEIGCFLMPHPGLKVATSSSFDGKIRDIEPQFVRHLSNFIDGLLSPERLIVKKIDGQTIKVKDLLQYFKTYSEMYQKSEIPEPKTILAATAEANNLAASAAAKDTYQNNMEELCGSSKPYTSLNLLEEYHAESKAKSMGQFTSQKKMGGEDFSEGYRTKLEKEIDDMFIRFKIINENKNLFKSARTPAVLFSIAILFYIVSGVFGFLGFYTLANISNLMTTAAVVGLLTWAYVRYNGTSLEIGIMIDNIANGMWDNLMYPICNTLFQKSEKISPQTENRN